MSAQRRPRFAALARLFRYPGDDYAADAEALARRFAAEGSAAAEALAELVAYARTVSGDELAETYTRTFDLNPACAPEIGWHLFGEEYVRGLFLVRLRQELRRHGLEETGELPDHVVHVLAVMGAMDEPAARELARACVCPAVGKMLAALDKGPGPQPLRPLVAALAELLLEEFALPRSALEASEESSDPGARSADRLHAAPCGGCAAQAVVPLAVERAADGQNEEYV